MADSDFRPAFFPQKDRTPILPKEKFTKPPKSLTPEEISKLDLTEALGDRRLEMRGKGKR